VKKGRRAPRRPVRPFFGCQCLGIEAKTAGNRVLFGFGRRFRAFTSLRDMSLAATA